MNLLECHVKDCEDVLYIQNSSQINIKGKKQFMAAINATVIFVMIASI